MKDGTNAIVQAEVIKVKPLMFTSEQWIQRNTPEKVIQEPLTDYIRISIFCV